MRYSFKFIPVLVLASLLVAGYAGAEESEPLTNSSHPSLFCTADDLPAIRGRLDREPYLSWWTNAVRLADANYEVDEETEFVQLEYARRARHAALCYLVKSDEAYAEKALRWMSEFPRMEPAEMTGKTHLRLAQTARDFAEAYDMLLPWLEANHPGERKTIADELRYVGWELREFGPNWYGVHKNNHGVRQFGGLGLVALALRDDPDYSEEASLWLEYATTQCLVHLRYQVCDEEEGGFSEGINYLSYSGQIMWDLFYALKNVTGRDLWAEEDIRNLHIYAARAQMPTGCWPMFDDCSYGYFPSQIFCDAYPDVAGMFVNQYLEREAAWAAGYGEFNNNGSRLKPADDYILSILHYDDSIEPAPPEYPIVEVLAEAGDAVFRSGEGPEAVYLNFRIEGVRAAFNAAGHDHSDPLSFFLQAYGENLLLDPGYIKWEDRRIVSTADNHNMITVGDKDPVKFLNSVPLEGFVQVVDWGIYNDVTPFVEAKTSYNGATITRNIEYVMGSIFFIHDTITSGKEQSFTYNLHGHAGAESGGTFTMQDESLNGGVVVYWERDRGGVACEVICYDPDAEYIVDEDEHSFAYGEWTTHKALRVKATGKEIKFLTMVIPYQAGERPDLGFTFNGTIPELTE